MTTEEVADALKMNKVVKTSFSDRAATKYLRSRGHAWVSEWTELIRYV